ncbi:superinfection immunity protein [Cellulomonas bogoriensis]|nr:superinfection immunity protein [Cellulomonas bogoriensis]
MLPWAIAVTRGRSNMAAVGVLNLLLGWSLIGWIVSLVMACQAHAPAVAAGPVNVVVAQQFPGAQFAGQAPPPQVQVTLVPAGWYAAPDGVGRQYWDGAAWTGHRAP